MLRPRLLRSLGLDAEPVGDDALHLDVLATDDVGNVGETRLALQVTRVLADVTLGAPMAAPAGCPAILTSLHQGTFEELSEQSVSGLQLSIDAWAFGDGGAVEHSDPNQLCAIGVPGSDLAVEFGAYFDGGAELLPMVNGQPQSPLFGLASLERPRSRPAPSPALARAPRASRVAPRTWVASSSPASSPTAATSTAPSHGLPRTR